MSSSSERFFPSKFLSNPRIYAYSISDLKEGQLKVGQTLRTVKERVREQIGILGAVDYRIEVDESALDLDGVQFTDHQVRRQLVQKGFENVDGEWMKCSAEDVLTAISELKHNQAFTAGRFNTYLLRNEQISAIEMTHNYFKSVWSEKNGAPPRFLWNAKMRFGKTFTTYKLAEKMNAEKILVMTFKPAVEDSWQVDLESHVDFEGWTFLNKSTRQNPSTLDTKSPIVYFASFQDLLGRDKETGLIKARNEWVHSINWDLVVLDEYHFGAHREKAQEMFEGEDANEARKELRQEYNNVLDTFEENLHEQSGKESDFLPITSNAYLYLSGTPFKALSSGSFIEEQIFNWTYSDEQAAKRKFAISYPDDWNPYEALPEMRIFTYRMPDELIAIANKGEFDEFDLNNFFAAEGLEEKATFVNKDYVQKWLDVIRGKYEKGFLEDLKIGKKPPFPYSDTRLLPYLQHSFWFMHNVSACHAMSNLLNEPYNVFWNDFNVVVVAGTAAGVGREALPPVRKAIGEGFDSKTIVLSCGKLATGVTVPEWSSILMLRNLVAPETYFQAAFRVQSPWSIVNPNGDNPQEEHVVKPACYVFDFAPTRALRQIAEYATGLSPEILNLEKAVEELVAFLPVLAYDGSMMTQVDAGAILDIAYAGTSSTLLAKKWESAVLVNVDNYTLEKIIKQDGAIDVIMKIEGFRSLGADVFENVINKNKDIKKTKKEKADDLSNKEKKELSNEEKELKSLRKQIQEKLLKFATRIPAFMYLTDFRENTLKDVITKLEPELFEQVTGLTVKDFDLLVSIGVFNATEMNRAVNAFRRYEDASLRYTGIMSHDGLTKYGLYDTVIGVEES